MPSRASLVAAAGLAGLAAVAVGAVPAGTAARGQTPPVVRVTCGGYDAVPSGTRQSGNPTRLSIQKDGRLLQTISDWVVTRIACADLDADQVPELLVTTNSGGAHCCDTLRVWSLGVALRPTLEYEAGNAAGFELRDLDGDGRLELLLGDDSFAFYDDLPYTSAPRTVPLAACLAGGVFADCTARFPELLRAAASRWSALLQPAGPAIDQKQVEGAALGVLAASVLLGEESAALESIRAAVASDEVMRWLEKARPKVREWARGRGKRLRKGNK